MKLTIVAEDQCVGIDGEYYVQINFSQLDPSIHAVQWYGEYGEVEYKSRFENGVIVRPNNVIITDVTPYQFAIDAWNTAKLAAEQAEAAAQNLTEEPDPQ